MPNSSRSRQRRPKTGALLALAAVLLPAGALSAAVPAQAAQTQAQTQPQSQEPRAGAPRVTAAVLPLDGSRQRPAVYGDDTAYDTASIIKVDILAAALLRAQDAGRTLTAQERAYAEPMIRQSDNASANALWRQIGEAPGLDAANRRLGLTETRGGSGPRWGLTRTTASDQIRLLRAVFAPESGGTTSDGTAGSRTTGSGALNAASRAYIRTLMNGIADDQDWGVSAAGSPAGAALKNGWLQRSTSGLWDVNSVGRITVDGRPCLVAVLSDGNASMSEGVSLVERTARAAVSSTAAH
ncbi:serine hydrolase [Streptomyces sp. PsTaAH-124]|uniref:serine hydrolase n=1 Tax=Streptomyces sp. PsTaAH-124 TaxID=1157638 RepID=UPI00037D9029|nr:serine hydrolase [Streptomyces sp. PsTaAH-124]